MAFGQDGEIPLGVSFSGLRFVTWLRVRSIHNMSLVSLRPALSVGFGFVFFFVVFFSQGIHRLSGLPLLLVKSHSPFSATL